MKGRDERSQTWLGVAQPGQTTGDRSGQVDQTRREDVDLPHDGGMRSAVRTSRYMGRDTDGAPTTRTPGTAQDPAQRGEDPADAAVAHQHRGHGQHPGGDLRHRVPALIDARPADAQREQEQAERERADQRWQHGHPHHELNPAGCHASVSTCAKTGQEGDRERQHRRRSEDRKRWAATWNRQNLAARPMTGDRGRKGPVQPRRGSPVDLASTIRPGTLRARSGR